jgi:hypothetical protein
MLRELYTDSPFFSKKGMARFSMVLLCAFSHTTSASNLSGPGDSQVRDGSTSATPPLEFRGYLQLDGRPSFSLRDMETGGSWWMRIGQERFGFRLEQFNPEQMEITVSWDGQRTSIPLNRTSNSNGLVVDSSIDLSPAIQKVYDLSEELIKTTRSETTNRLVKDHRKVEKLRGFLAQNPSVAELHDFLPELGDAFNYDEFLKIEFPPIMKGRNKQNTPRWGVDKSMDLADIEQLIASNPSAAQLESELSQK